METYESKVKKVNANAADIYRVLSDLNNVKKFKEMLPPDKAAQFDEKVSDFECDTDSVHFSVSPIGKMGLLIVDREPDKVIKFGGEKSPVDFNMWIQMKQTGDNVSAMKITLKADLPFMLKMMVASKIEKGIEQMADMLAQLPYGMI